jgi:hypothetical protein
MTRSGAATISQITSSPEFAGRRAPDGAPGVEEIIDHIRDILRHRLRSAERELRTGNLTDERRAEVQSRYDRSQNRIARFEEMLKTVPAGFQLTPTFYIPVDEGSNNAVYKEYQHFVRSRFLQYLAKFHAGELSKLGICDHGIKRMANGLDPATVEGKAYEVNIDHIIERGGSGRWPHLKGKDPDAHPNAPERSPVNFYGNLMLMPENVHEFKNELNGFQFNIRGGENPRDGKWILMMTPVRDDRAYAGGPSGFVCAPQTDPNYALRLRTDNVHNDIRYAAKTAEFLAGKVYAIHDNRRVQEVLADLRARHPGERSLADIGKAEEQQQGKSPLRDAFAAAIASERRAVNYIEEILKPALADAAHSLSNLFNTVSAKTISQDRRGFAAFMEFYHKDDMAELRDAVAALPLAEASAFLKTCRDIDRDISGMIAARHAEQPPRNDNVPSQPPAAAPKPPRAI